MRLGERRFRPVRISGQYSLVGERLQEGIASPSLGVLSPQLGQVARVAIPGGHVNISLAGGVGVHVPTLVALFVVEKAEYGDRKEIRCRYVRDVGYQRFVLVKWGDKLAAEGFGTVEDCVEEDIGLSRRMRVSILGAANRERTGQTYSTVGVVVVDSGNKCHLGREILGNLFQRLPMVQTLVNRENEVGIEGHAAVRLIEDLIRGPQNDAIAASSATEGPEEIGILLLGCGDKRSISCNNHGLDEGVDNQTVDTLKSAHTTANGSANNARASAGARYCCVSICYQLMGSVWIT